MAMKDKLSSIRKKGPQQEFSPEIEAELEEDVEVPAEEEELLGVEEESEMASGSVEEVLGMLESLSTEELEQVREEVDMLIEGADMAEAEEEDMDIEGLDYEEEDEEEDLEL